MMMLEIEPSYAEMVLPGRNEPLLIATEAMPPE